MVTKASHWLMPCPGCLQIQHQILWGLVATLALVWSSSFLSFSSFLVGLSWSLLPVTLALAWWGLTLWAGLFLITDCWIVKVVARVLKVSWLMVVTISLYIGWQIVHFCRFENKVSSAKGFPNRLLSVWIDLISWMSFQASELNILSLPNWAMSAIQQEVVVTSLVKPFSIFFQTWWNI